MFLNYILGEWGTGLYSVHFDHKPTYEAFLVLITKKLTIYLHEIKKLSFHSETSEKNACQKIKVCFLGGLEIILYFSHFLVEYLVATLNFFDKVLSWNVHIITKLTGLIYLATSKQGTKPASCSVSKFSTMGMLKMWPVIRHWPVLSDVQ